MMKKITAITLTLAALALSACGGAKTEEMIASGNEAFAQQDYATALNSYQQAAVENPALAEPIYNAANVQYRQGEFEQTNATLQVALANADEGLAAEGYFNLGNTHFQTEQYAEAVDAYKESLRLNPNDIDAKVNLELALQRLQQEQQEQQQQDEQSQDQQEQEQQNQDEQSQDEQSQDEQSQDEQSQDEQSQDEQSQDEQSQDEQSQDEQSQDEQSQDEQSQDEQSQDQQDESEQQDGEGEEEEQDQSQQPQAGGEPSDEEADPAEMSLGELLEMDGLTEEQARQLLVAAAQGTETLQEYLQQIYVFPHSDVEQDW